MCEGEGEVRVCVRVKCVCVSEGEGEVRVCV